MMRETGSGSYARFHLRVDKDGSGMLLANATAGAHLSATGVLMAKKLLDGADEATILHELASYFEGAAPDTARRDLQRVRRLIDTLANPGDVYPIVAFEDTAFSPYEAQLIAPLQATLPLTEPAHMQRLLGRLWEIGVPHVTIMVPPEPSGETLLQAVEYAEDLGMIAGVRGRGGTLDNIELLRDLALAGVDYITLPFVPLSSDIHDKLYGTGDYACTERAIATLQEYEVCPVAEVPLVAATVDLHEQMLDRLATLGVTNAALFALAAARENLPDQQQEALTAASLLQVATSVEENSYRRQVRVTWQPPLLRDPTVALHEQVQHGPRCFGDVAVRVEPDGAVIPPRGAYRSAGNLFSDPWEQIWNDAAFRIYRERVPAPDTASGLPDLTLAAAEEQAGTSPAGR